MNLHEYVNAAMVPIFGHDITPAPVGCVRIPIFPAVATAPPLPSGGDGSSSQESP